MKLLFVYNAESGRLHALIDIAHKIIRPETYDCALCALTFNAFSEKKEWKQFRQENGIEMIFLHKDEFEQHYEKWPEYPVVLKEADHLQSLINTEELSSISSLSELITLVKERSTK